MKKVYFKPYFLFFCLTLLHQLTSAQMPFIIKEIDNISSGDQSWQYPNITPVVNNKAVFWKNDGIHGNELWVSDGTEAGTTILKDITPGSSGTSVGYSALQTDNGIFFMVGDNIDERDHTLELWFTDGTSSNTRLILKEDNNNQFRGLNTLDRTQAKYFNHNLYFAGSAISSNMGYDCIYKVNSTSTQVASSSVFHMKAVIYALEVFQNNLIVSSGTYSNVSNTWFYDLSVITGNNSSAGTFFTNNNAAIRHMINVNDHYLAFAYLPSGSQYMLAKFDNVNQSTPIELTTLYNTFLSNCDLGPNSIITTIDNKLYFYKNACWGAQLWVSDGTAGGTIAPPFTYSNVRYFGQEGNGALFQVYDVNGYSKALMWDGNPNAAQVYSENASMLEESLQQKVTIGNRTFLFTGKGTYLRKYDDASTYKLYGQGPSPYMMIDVGNAGQSEVYRNILNNQIVALGYNYRRDNNNNNRQLYNFNTSIKIWTGAISKDWNESLNWEPSGAPTQNDDVLIAKSNSGNYPSINQSVSCKSLFINYGPIEILSSGQISVYGELSNYNVVNGTGKIILSSGTDSKLTGKGEYNISAIDLQGANIINKDESKIIHTSINFVSNAKIFLNQYDFRMENETPFVGYGNQKFVVTNGLGSLIIYNKGIQSFFPIGSDASNYNPIAVPGYYNINGVRVVNGSFENGISGAEMTNPGVNKSWSFSSRFQLPPTVKLFWNATQEVNGFNRSSAKISGHNGSSWENSAAAAADPEADNYFSRQVTFTSNENSVFKLISEVPLNTYYQDSDGDGYGNESVIQNANTQPLGYVTNSTDCDDTKSSVYPTATEVCNGIDDDCDGLIDEEVKTPFYRDADGDGYGDQDSEPIQACSAPEGYVANNTDCNDATASAYTSATWYRDEDGDGFGNPNISMKNCAELLNPGYVLNNSDCDDTKKLYSDIDGDGYGSTSLVACSGVANNSDCNDNNININPGKTEICGNNIDDNCNGQIDEGCTIEPNPTVSINDITVYENAGIATLSVSLSNAYTQDIKINYQTIDRTAVSKGRVKDFVAGKGSIVIPAGQTKGLINVNILTDNLLEQDETFDVAISLGRNASATISKGTGIVTIKDGATLINKAFTVQKAEVLSDAFEIIAYPNPSSQQFTLQITSSNKEVVSVNVYDIFGRMVQRLSNIGTNTSLKLGSNYKPGVYIVEIQQGEVKKLFRLIKISE